MVYVMGIDPGTVSTGVSFLRLSTDVTVEAVEAYTLSPVEQFTKTHTWYLQGHEDRVPVITSELNRLLVHYNPDYAVIESPFYNSLRPAAYGPLSELLYALKHTVVSYNRGCSLITLSPSQIKTAVFANSIGNKQSVKDALLKIDELTPLISPFVDIWSEHAIDATAAAYAYLRLMREFPAWAF